MDIKEIAIKDIVVAKNARSSYKDVDMAGLMASIKESGLLQPVCVKKVKGKYSVVYGNRRVLACQKLKLTHIPAIISKSKSKSVDMVQHLAENLQRADITAFDLGRYVDICQTEMEVSIDELSVRLGVTKNRLKNSLAIFERLPEQFRKKVKSMPTTKANKTAIPTSIAATVINFGKSYRMKQNDVIALLKGVQVHCLTMPETMEVLKLIRSGKPVVQALKEADKLISVGVNVVLTQKDKQRIEDKTGLKIRDAIKYAFLSKYKIAEA